MNKIVLVTDSTAKPHELDKLRESGLDVVIAEEISGVVQS